jgi:deoxyribose-phosphate aldolase
VGSSTLVGGPIGFPSGGHTTVIKLAEARSLVEAGADELDMMINLGRLKSGDLGYVRDEIKAVAETIAPVLLKVILEVSRLTDDEIRRGSEAAVNGGAASHTSGLSMLSCKATVRSRRPEGSAILRPSRRCFHLELPASESIDAWLSS